MVIESASSMPLHQVRCWSEKIADRAVSTVHVQPESWRLQISEIATRSSTVPEFVVPAVATTQNGFRPAARSSWIA